MLRSTLAGAPASDYRARMSDTENPETETPAAGPDVPPDHLAIHPSSPHFNGELLARGIGIRFKGAVRSNVEEYCISEGWVKVQAGRTTDRKGMPLLLKLNGPVEAWFEDLGENAPVASAG